MDKERGGTHQQDQGKDDPDCYIGKEVPCNVLSFGKHVDKVAAHAGRA